MTGPIRPPVPGAARRLGYLLSHYPSANHTYLLREVRALRAAGVSVVVVAVEGDARPAAVLTPDEREERATTVVVKRAGVASIAAAHVATLVTRPLRYAAGFGAALRLAGPDLKRIAYHLLYFGEAVVAGRLLHRAKCAHVHTHYSTTVAVIAERVFRFDLSASIHGSAEFIDPWAQRLREKVAACVFVRAISSYGRSQLMLATPPSEWSKFAVVRLGVDPDAFAVPDRVRTDGPLRLASVGQLQPAKGFHLLLDALASVVGAGHDVVITIVGDGAERGSLAARARTLGLEARVRFTGALNQTEVRTVLRESDAFVLASFAEGIPVVLMEAMASGLPCVATRITGIPELVEHGVSGLLVTPAEERELAGAITQLAHDPELRTRLGRAARARVERDYDLRKNTGRLVDLFVEALAGRCPADEPATPALL